MFSSYADSEPQREYILFEKVDHDLSGCLDRNEVDNIFLAFDTDRRLFKKCINCLSWQIICHTNTEFPFNYLVVFFISQITRKWRGRSLRMIGWICISLETLVKLTSSSTRLMLMATVTWLTQICPWSTATLIWTVKFHSSFYITLSNTNGRRNPSET